MLTGVHFILTYTCNFECDHCFLYCSPQSEGTFTLNQVRTVFKDLKNIPSVNSICFEGGESFLFYPILLEGVKLAGKAGFKTAIETNTYWATSVEDARFWLQPLKESGLCTLEVSDDAFHFGEETENSARRAIAAARDIELEVNTLSIGKPEVRSNPAHEKGKPIYVGGPKMRGRAVDTLAGGLPTQSWKNFKECPFEDLRNPDRVHIDPYGNVHLCQGLSMGNIWETPLSELFHDYDVESHPICGPLVRGGPARLAREYAVDHEEEYVDACHFCTHLCKSLIDTFPDIITPKQIYGLE
jgi:hypothetical protein